MEEEIRKLLRLFRYLIYGVLIFLAIGILVAVIVGIVMGT